MNGWEGPQGGCERFHEASYFGFWIGDRRLGRFRHSTPNPQPKIQNRRTPDARRGFCSSFPKIADLGYNRVVRAALARNRTASNLAGCTFPGGSK